MLFKISFIKFKRHLKAVALSSTVSTCFWDFIILKFCDSYYMFHEPCFVNFKLLFFPRHWHTIITKKVDYQHLVVSWFFISIEFAFEWCNTLKLRKIHFRPVTFKIWRFLSFCCSTYICLQINWWPTFIDIWSQISKWLMVNFIVFKPGHVAFHDAFSHQDRNRLSIWDHFYQN